MRKSDELIGLLIQNPLTDQTKKLKAILESNPLYLARFQEIILLQKTMVKQDVAGNRKAFGAAREAYAAKLAELTAFPAVAEYLNCVAELGDLAKEIAEILNEGIQTPAFPK
jgi:cell fate (sporulation/competence/biofilm development) regulator YmcA (YheA/YmcA/DUF963 family)